MNQYYKNCLEEGLAFQDYVTEKLYNLGIPLVTYSSRNYQLGVGENKAGIEIKFDRKFRETGNFYIETAEKADPKNKNYVPSGIYRNDNTWLYLIGDYQTIYVFSKEQLKKCSDKFRKVETPTSKGFLLPVEKALEFLVILQINCL